MRNSVCTSRKSALSRNCWLKRVMQYRLFICIRLKRGEKIVCYYFDGKWQYWNNKKKKRSPASYAAACSFIVRNRYWKFVQTNFFLLFRYRRFSTVGGDLIPKDRAGGDIKYLIYKFDKTHRGWRHTRVFDLEPPVFNSFKCGFRGDRRRRELLLANFGVSWIRCALLRHAHGAILLNPTAAIGSTRRRRIERRAQPVLSTCPGSVVRVMRFFIIFFHFFIYFFFCYFSILSWSFPFCERSHRTSEKYSRVEKIDVVPVATWG